MCFVLKVGSLGLQQCYSSSLWTQKEPIGPKQFDHNNLFPQKDNRQMQNFITAAPELDAWFGTRSSSKNLEGRSFSEGSLLFFRLIEDKDNKHNKGFKIKMVVEN